MLKNLIARDVMTHPPVCLQIDTDGFEAIKLLIKKEISGGPVVDVEGRYIGTFSEMSAMHFLINAAYDELPSHTIGPFVDRQVPTIGPETDLLKIIQMFVDTQTRRLPVLDGDRLVGIVSRRDVMRRVDSLCESCESHDRARSLYLSAVRAEGDIPDRVVSGQVDRHVEHQPGRRL